MKKIAIIGSGTMGNGIAHVFCLNGYRVNLIDISQQALDQAVNTINLNMDRQIKKETISEEDKKRAMDNLETGTHLEQGVESADLVIEAVIENIDIKKEIFMSLDSFTPEETILASNTSSISISQLASYTARPGKVIGMHFMNPVPMMELVEVIRGYNTSDNTINTVVDICRKIQKIPVEVQDYPGFIANRILMPMINESIYALQEGVAGVSEIDTIMKLGMAHPMGPLQLADYIGLDVCLSILKVMFNGFGDPKYAPCPLLVNMVQADHLGRKSGEGFYLWEAGKKELVVSPRFQPRSPN
ncbi:MAG: 3-hydroxyacyl-CoA dehydrogenase NAD-binding domain-containing protein [Cyclobacteriaceae bacterium]|jgi:3-hydroxybutyryl-CoA dehydrogenase